MHLNHNLKTLRVLFCRFKVDRPSWEGVEASGVFCKSCLQLHDRAKEDRPLYSKLCSSTSKCSVKHNRHKDEARQQSSGWRSCTFAALLLRIGFSACMAKKARQAKSYLGGSRAEGSTNYDSNKKEAASQKY